SAGDKLIRAEGLRFLLTRAPPVLETERLSIQGLTHMHTAVTSSLRLSICLGLLSLLPGPVSAAAPTTAPAIAPATQPSLLPELETRVGSFVPEDWSPLPDKESRQLVALVVKRGGAPLRVATREE